MGIKQERLEFVSYDGGFPNLCSGTLIMRLDEVSITFPDHCLSSGGNVWFDDDWGEHIEAGDWSITDFPLNFPKELRDIAVELVNANVPCGCCGGCV